MNFYTLNCKRSFLTKESIQRSYEYDAKHMTWGNENGTEVEVDYILKNMNSTRKSDSSNQCRKSMLGLSLL